MNFNWKSYLEFAQNLLDEVRSSWGQEVDLSMQEAKMRSAISRAYYSVFCLVRNHLRDVEGYNELINLKTDVHKYIIDEILLVSQDQTFINLGKDLRSLRLLRNKADYDDKINGLFADLTKALKLGNTIIKNLEALINNTAK